ncbi:Peptidase S8/S53 domain-containing protein [Cinnamomum micranthum f. kanehirae]|uniref:Peptidase S8/S53 domain-containing protein n=1 Tax=Cinnamomum micranthum f. kanehirae TaxID=337451 RepID=A0A3S3PUH8_9MAGN|nr:Peptidase S8/S53 domain-containing protein [Cinnamomum micranthum f. kanehirae]
MALLFLFAVLLFFGFSTAVPNQGAKSNGLQTYIVHVREPHTTVSPNSLDRESWYRSFLPTTSITGSEDGYDRMIYSYQLVMTGFAATLSEDEVKAMEKKDGFITAYPDELLPLHTTHTPDFLGLKQDMGVWKNSNFGKGVIIGVLDTGAMPNHPSFSDLGMPSPPPKWKGKCEFSACNKKIIGARSFVEGAKAMLGISMPASPSDENGHGTHTASTAAGAFVEGANVLGNANGTAVGMAPFAHLAIYKVCGQSHCANTDLLAGIESAIQDGVDVMSISIGSPARPNFYTRAIDIGTFKAMQKGIFISCSAGNSGPYKSTVSNSAPWCLTVGASTMDRSVRTTVMLGNGEFFNGESLFQPKDFQSNKPLPIIFPSANGDTTMCINGSLDGIDVKGKAVLCERGRIGDIAKGLVVKNAGGAAMILMNTEDEGFSLNARAHVLPASQVSFLDGSKIKTYINSTLSPTAMILFKGTILGTSPSPMVISFSSRGPNLPSPGILKPDIIGPGVSVLAGWPLNVGSFPILGSTFNIISGTSMSCPHLSGIAALLKSSHPDWSPAAIKSAIMTTADVLDNQGKQIVDERLTPAELFATGAGHVNPSRANDPGLIYDLTPDDYLAYLCGLGYTDSQVRIVAGGNASCSMVTSIREGELNYPSFSVTLGPAQTFNRTVTNVGDAMSAYSVEIIKPQGVDVSVKPDALHFSSMNEKLTYSVTFSPMESGSGGSIGFAEAPLGAILQVDACPVVTRRALPMASASDWIVSDLYACEGANVTNIVLLLGQREHSQWHLLLDGAVPDLYPGGIFW